MLVRSDETFFTAMEVVQACFTAVKVLILSTTVDVV